MKKAKIYDYPFTIRHLAEKEGGGYFIEYPDLPGCMSDGETIEETIKNGQDAIACWIDAAKATGRDIPKPGEFENQSGKWLQRVPKSIHLRLIGKAKEEGVSLNTLVISILIEGLCKHEIEPTKKTYKSLKNISQLRACMPKHKLKISSVKTLRKLRDEGF